MAFLVQLDVIEVVYMDCVIQQCVNKNRLSGRQAFTRVCPGPLSTSSLLKPSSEVKACAIFGDELVILIKQNITSSQNATTSQSTSTSWNTQYSFVATNVNALLLLAAGERLEWKTLTLQHDDTSEQALHADWSKAELFNMVKENSG